MCNNTFEVLQWRDAMKLSQWESLDIAAGVDRENVYQVAKRFHATSDKAHRRYNQYQKSRKICNKLTSKSVSSSIVKPCAASGRHHCLDVFREAPGAVLRWRKIWYAMPKPDREARMQNMYNKALQQHTNSQRGDPSNFQMQYAFFGP